MNEKNAMYNSYLKNNNNQSFATFQSFQSQISSLIVNLKNKYYSKVTKNILDPRTRPKTYWSILKTFLNNKKIPIIPPIFHDINLLLILNKKLKYFNSHFSRQYTPLISNSKISSECPRKSNESLSSITFEINNTEKIKTSTKTNLMAMICSVFAC